MTNPRRAAALTALKLADLGVVVGAFVASVFLSLTGESWYDVLSARIEVRNVLFMVGYLVYWHVVLVGSGFYHSHRLTPLSREWRDLLFAVIVATVPLFLASKPLGLGFSSASFLVNFALLAFAGLVIQRRVFRMLARAMRRHGHNIRHVVVIGHDEDALEMAGRLARRADLGYHIVEVIETGDLGAKGALTPAQIVYHLEELLATRTLDEVFLAVPLDAGQPVIRAVVPLCEERGITVRVVSSIMDLILAKAQVDEIEGHPVITVFTGPPDSPLLAVKRLIDIVVSLGAMITLAPLFAMVAVAIKLDSRGPVFFVQRRVGLGARQFPFFKFRTMVQDAERLQSRFEHLNEANGPVFKIKQDPRITRVGRFIRRTSLDELPQLINVLKGDMSLVGPRPLPLRDVARMDVPAHRRRFSVKPGITCLWQIEGREPDFNAWIRTDMAYIDNWSLGLDMKILARTIPAVLSGRGAY